MFRSTRTPCEPGSDWLLNNQFDTGASATLRMIGGTLSDAPWVEGHETKWKHQEAYNVTDVVMGLRMPCAEPQSPIQGLRGRTGYRPCWCRPVAAQ